MLYLLHSHCFRISVSVNLWVSFLQFRTTIMNWRRYNFTKLARHGPAVDVTPVFMPWYSPLVWSRRWVLVLDSDRSTIRSIGWLSGFSSRLAGCLPDSCSNCNSIHTNRFSRPTYHLLRHLHLNCFAMDLQNYSSSWLFLWEKLQSLLPARWLPCSAYKILSHWSNCFWYSIHRA